MNLERRSLLRLGLAAAAGAVEKAAGGAEHTGGNGAEPEVNHVGVLVDTTLCIGCRKCEEACNRRNSLPRAPESFSDRDVLRSYRRPSENAFTVVNVFPGSPSPDQADLSSTSVKTQCMHCLYPSCVSACIVGALKKSKEGPVVYNPDICLGCRYCMVACPFEIPAYQFNEALKPKVRKCEFCTDRSRGTGADPACAASCPTEALVFGRRADLLLMAKERLKRRPDRYLNHIYGETEVGGTSWLYLTGRPLQEVGLLNLSDTPPPQRTEAIQHGVFRYGILPIAFYGVLSGLLWRNQQKGAEHGDHPSAPSTRQTGGEQ